MMLTVSITVRKFDDDEMRAFRAALRELVLLAFDEQEPEQHPKQDQRSTQAG